MMFVFWPAENKDKTELRARDHDRFPLYHKDNGHCALVPVYPVLGAGTGYERWLEDDLKVKNVIEEGWREEEGADTRPRHV